MTAKFMRFPRGKADGQGYYHCVSRVVEGRFIFQVSGHGSVETERFIMLMRRLEAFSGVRVLTYVLMSNHFHLLCEVPEPKTLSEAEVLERVEAGYGPGTPSGPPTGTGPLSAATGWKRSGPAPA